jgi:hypothetical protein
MPAATFDTLKFAKSLISAGVPPDQAEAQAVAFAEVIQLNFKDLATKDGLTDLRTETKRDLADVKTELKRDIADLRTELKRDIADLRTELKHDIAETKAELKREIVDVRGELKLVKWMIGVAFTFMLAGFGIIARLIVTQAR